MNATHFYKEFWFSIVDHGRLYGSSWGTVEMKRASKKHWGPQPSAEEHFNALYSELSPEYFIVIKRFHHSEKQAEWESERYKDLRSLLNRNFPVAAKDDDFVVFDLKKKENRGEREATHHVDKLLKGVDAEATYRRTNRASLRRDMWLGSLQIRLLDRCKIGQ